jgi:hypothetical protein
MKTKICLKCNIIKPLSEFGKDKRTKSGLASKCKNCKSKYFKDYYKLNAKKIKLNSQKRREQNPEYNKNYSKDWRKIHPNSFRLWFEQNKEYRNNYMNLYFKEKRKNDTSFKLTGDIRTRINQAIKNNFKRGRFLELLGCSVEELRKHLESQFKPRMSWDNHSLKGWHIDHIKPCASFDLSKPEEQLKCFHYTNLQPLWAKENLKKGNN